LEYDGVALFSIYSSKFLKKMLVQENPVHE